MYIRTVCWALDTQVQTQVGGCSQNLERNISETERIILKALSPSGRDECFQLDRNKHQNIHSPLMKGWIFQLDRWTATTTKTLTLTVPKKSHYCLSKVHNSSHDLFYNWVTPFHQSIRRSIVDKSFSSMGSVAMGITNISIIGEFGSSNKHMTH